MPPATVPRPPVVALTLLLLALVACGAGESDGGHHREEPPVTRGRVLLIGVDGASTRLVDELLAEGRLPNLAALRRAGLQAVLQSPPPYLSPRIWNSIATGKKPRVHGIRNFIRKDEHGSHLVLSTDRKVHALWNIASAAGLRVATVNWWNTYPPEKINGVMISDHAITGDIEIATNQMHTEEVPQGARVYPAEWHDRLDVLFADVPLPEGFRNPIREEGGAALPDYFDKQHLDQAFLDDARVMRVALDVEERARPDLLLVFLPGIDRYSHWLWGGTEPLDRYDDALRPTAEQNALSERILRRYYDYTDALIGPLIARYGDDDLVIVLSDHGFERSAPDRPQSGNHLTPEAGDAILFARGPGLDRSAKEVDILDITPSILSWLEIPSGEDMPGSATAFLTRPEPERIATHERGEIERLPLVSSGKEEEILDHLRALGYIE